MVLFTSAIHPIKASPAPDFDVTVEVTEADHSAVEAPAVTPFINYQITAAGSQYTAMEVCSVHTDYDGLIDHQIIIVQAPENNLSQAQAGYNPYRPRSNIDHLSTYG